MSQDFIENLEFEPDETEKKYVHNIYSKISQHFNLTRNATWPKISEFISSLPSGSFIIDIGCGNGRNMNLRKDCFFQGLDYNMELFQKSTHKNLNLIQGDNLNIPLREGIADTVLSIAVIHHFCTETRRIKALRELFKILKPNGKILISVWSYEQEKFNHNKQDILLKWHNRINNNIVHRYYHLFKKNELENIITNNFNNIKILESSNQEFNWYVIAIKLF
tara:strand:- start:1185 stop:1847 length:663 start_codon:yes stop_codon:yes gene_type:complete